MKKLLILILIVAALVAGGPLIIGSQAEKFVRQSYEKAQTNPNLKVTLSSYESGWFSSKAIIRLEINSSNFPGGSEIPAVDLVQKVFHGPILWETDGFALGLLDSTINVQLPDDVKTELASKGSFTDETITAAFRVFFDERVNFALKAKPFQISDNSGALTFNDAEIKANANKSGKLLINGYWNGLSVSENQETKLEVGKLSLNSEQQLVVGEMFSNDAVYSGFFKAEFEKLAIEPSIESQSALLNNLSLSLDSKVVDQVVNYAIILRANQLQAAGQNLTNLTYDLSLENLDIETIRKMARSLSDPAIANDPMAAQAEIMGLLPELVKSGPVFKINQIGMTTPQGDIETHLEMTIDKDVYDASNPMTMMLALTAKADGKAPAPFFSQFGMDQEIEQLVAQSFLKRDAETLSFEFTFAQGQALLNGNPIPLGGM